MVWLLSFTKPVPGLKSYSSKTQGCQQLGIGGGGRRARDIPGDTVRDYGQNWECSF